MTQRRPIVNVSGLMKELPVGDSVFGVRPLVFHVQDQKATSTHAANATAATWNVREFNTVVENTVPGASLSSNQLILPANTYILTAGAPAGAVGRHQIRLRNITDGATTLLGMSQSTDVNYSIFNSSGINGVKFTIAGTKTFELQHFTELSQGAGLGAAVVGGEVNVYADARFEVVSP